LLTVKIRNWASKLAGLMWASDQTMRLEPHGACTYTVCCKVAIVLVDH
jgi:hypothetical protein